MNFLYDKFLPEQVSGGIEECVKTENLESNVT